MASIASSSSNFDIEAGPASALLQAGPLPTKRGEIGYVENAVNEARNSSPEAILPAHHPDDRDHSAPITSAASSDTSAPSTLDNTLTPPSTSTLVSSERSNVMKKKVLSFFKSKKNPSFYGINLTTLLTLFLLLVALGGSLAGWVISAKAVAHDTPNTFNLTTIVIHVLFASCVLCELLFIERRIYRLRAERYAYLHPGETLPTLRNRRPVDPNMAFSPWNRPSLPTYAATLAQSGTGTGDVEDHLIAVPPPPAYGNTRGSTLLLSGFLRNSLLARTSEQSRPQSRQNRMSQRSDRPKSYHSRDEEWEEIQDAARARELEETLARLQRPASYCVPPSRRSLLQ
ncbi:hypothetical protein J132_00592 [Termitomyces sp. J132]|nr:hypothetical protein H2248_007224 [Termitomyces sp. 'cryptogamus']KNZ73203.1 hypothetical protein J132_00592 [Termitomyces sp. J132]